MHECTEDVYRGAQGGVRACVRQMAGRASVELHTLIFFKNRVVVTEARVTKARLPPAPAASDSAAPRPAFMPRVAVHLRGRERLQGLCQRAPPRAGSHASRRRQVRANGLIVFIPKYGIEGPVYFSGPEDAQPDGEWVLDAEAMTVTSRDGAQQYAIFDACSVRIRVERVGTVGGRQRLALALVGSGAPEAEVVEMQSEPAAAAAPAPE